MLMRILQNRRWRYRYPPRSLGTYSFFEPGGLTNVAADACSAVPAL